MEKTPVYLICIDAKFGAQGHNKFYQMTPNGDGTFTAEYGRVGASPQKRLYPISKWDSIVASKLKKGYIERTNLMMDVIEDSKETEEKTDDFVGINNSSIKNILKRLLDYANNTIQSSYKVTASAVTQAMIDTAQEKIDYLSTNYKNMTVSDFNDALTKLFITIPRKMKMVSSYLATDFSDFPSIIDREQSLLDTMAGQVYKKKETSKCQENKSQKNILDKMGIIMEECTEDDIVAIKKAMGDAQDKFYQAWRVINTNTQKAYDEYVKQNNIGNVKLTCHGSRNQNWFNILRTGLKIRPAGVATNGSMFGLGCYFSNPDKWHGVAKSIGYTSLNGYWTRENQGVGFLAFFETALGDSYDVYSFDNKYYSFNLDKLKREKSTAWNLFAHGGTGMLKNDEIIIYNEAQTTIKYLVEIR